MIRSFSTMILAAAILLPNMSYAQTSAKAGNDAVTQTVNDTIDVQHLMDAYHQSVVTHDGARLATLFLPDGGAWLNVLTDDTYAHAKQKTPEAVKVRLSNYKTFADFVTKSKSNLDPQHSHLVIHTDGTIASIYFEYNFYIDGKVTNHGSEAWQVVRGSEGWRIAAITYSSTPALS